MRLLACALLVFAISATSVHAQQRRVQKKPHTGPIMLTSVDVKSHIGPDKFAWSKTWKDNAPTKLSFRWSTDYPDVESAVWRVSSDADGKRVIASGDAGRPPVEGRVAGFTIDFRPIVGNSMQRPLDYFVRVYTYKGSTSRLGTQPGRTYKNSTSRIGTQPARTYRRRSSIIAKADAQSPVVLKEQAGPPSRPVHVSILPSGPDTQFTEAGLHPELLKRMPIAVDLNTLKVRGAGGGEDPYLFVVVIYADGTTIIPEIQGGNLVFPTSRVGIAAAKKTHENVPVDVDPGANLAIPRSTGHFERTIRPIGIEQLANAHGRRLNDEQRRLIRQNTYVGVLVIGMEEDNLPSTEIVDEARDELVIALDARLKEIVRAIEVPVAANGQLVLPNLLGHTIGMAGEIRERLVESAKAKTLDQLSELLLIPGFPTLILAPGIANQDDYVGFGVTVFNYEQILNAGEGGLPIKMTLNQNYDGLPRAMQTDDPQSLYYKIEGKIRYLPDH